MTKSTYVVDLYVGGKYIDTVEVEAFDEDQARELAWGMVENYFVAVITGIKGGNANG